MLHLLSFIHLSKRFARQCQTDSKQQAISTWGDTRRGHCSNQRAIIFCNSTVVTSRPCNVGGAGRMACKRNKQKSTMALVDYYKSRTHTHNVNEIPMESGLFGLSNDTSFTLWRYLVLALQASQNSY
jgi:hypothetical protein